MVDGSDVAVFLVGVEDAFHRYEFVSGALVSSPIGLDDADATIAALVEVGEQTVLVGEVEDLGVDRVAIWLLDDGSAQRFDIETDQFSVGLNVDDAVATDDQLVVGGTSLSQNVVWTFTLQ